MSLVRLIFFFCTLVTISMYSHEAFGLDDNIYINSNTLEVDYAKEIAEYKTNVFVQKKENFDLYCDRAKIFSASKKTDNKNINTSTTNIKYIELYDNITIVKGPKIAKGDFGIIYPQKKLIILTGKVQLKEKTKTKEAYLEGSKVRYYIDRGTFEMQNDIASKNRKKGKVKIILNELNGKND